MRKTIASIALASILGLGAASAMAYPGMQGGPGMGQGPQCAPECRGNFRAGPMHGPRIDRLEHVKAGYASVERLIGLRDDQKAAWSAYVNARVKFEQDRKARWEANKGPALDQQTRLERRIERMKFELANLEVITAKRAELMKVLDAKQNYVLDQTEAHHGMRGHGRRGGPGMGPGQRGPKGPGVGPGPRGPQGEKAPAAQKS